MKLKSPDEVEKQWKVFILNTIKEAYKKKVERSVELWNS